ncbi:hypothetical protein ACLOJK_003117 [Asimina triloba]
MADGIGMHVVMLPWLAFGHMLPFLHLSTALAKAGIRVSFITTPRNIQRLPQIPHHLAHHISFVHLPLPAVDGLPKGVEATVDVVDDSDEYLKKAFHLSFPAFQQFIAHDHPDWIIHDIFPCWASRIAKESGIPHVFFSIYSAAILAFLGPLEAMVGDGLAKIWPSPESLTSPPTWLGFKTSVAFGPHEARGFYDAGFRPNASGLSAVEDAALTLEGSAAIAIRSCPEFEEEFLNCLKKLHQRPIIPIGLLPPIRQPEKRERDDDPRCRWANTFRWLDEQAPKSVVFVAFGTECKLSRDQVHGIAHGLELCGLPFLWALRRPVWAAAGNEECISSILPPEFERRVGVRGMINMGWAPQLEILAHPAIGGSLFHAGWSSIIETLQHGHVAVVLPLANVQTLDARHLVDKGLAIQVPVNRDDGSFHGDVIARSLRRAMVEDEGERLRNRVVEMKDVFADQKLHQDYMDRFVDFLKSKGW